MSSQGHNHEGDSLFQLRTRCKPGTCEVSIEMKRWRHSTWPESWPISPRLAATVSVTFEGTVQALILVLTKSNKDKRTHQALLPQILVNQIIQNKAKFLKERKRNIKHVCITPQVSGLTFGNSLFPTVSVKCGRGPGALALLSALSWSHLVKIPFAFLGVSGQPPGKPPAMVILV